MLIEADTFLTKEATANTQISSLLSGNIFPLLIRIFHFILLYLPPSDCHTGIQPVKLQEQGL